MYDINWKSLAIAVGLSISFIPLSTAVADHHEPQAEAELSDGMSEQELFDRLQERREKMRDKKDKLVDRSKKMRDKNNHHGPKDRPHHRDKKPSPEEKWAEHDKKIREMHDRNMNFDAPEGMDEMFNGPMDMEHINEY